MVLTIFGALLLAKWKHLRISKLFTSWVFYPVLFLEGVLLFFQINAFAGNYSYVQYAPLFHQIYTLSYLIPILTLKLWRPALIGSLSIVTGTLLNNFVIAQNGGKMPVFPTLSYLTGYVRTDTFSRVQDIHILGNSSTAWNFLSDWIDVGYSILSPGDVFIHFFSFLILYETIKVLNLRSETN